MKLSQRTRAVKDSVTFALMAKVQTLRSQGVDVVNFAAGEPDFDTPERIKQAALEALKKGFTKYTEVRGIRPLREAIAVKYRRDYGVECNEGQVLVSCGGKHALYNVLQALLDDGDEVIVPAPYWVSYPEMVRLCGGVPKILPAHEDRGFRVAPAQLEEVLSSRTRAFILNSPNNPTGVAYDREDLLALAHVLKRHSCLVISDDTYDRIVYDGFRFHSIVALEPELRDRTVIVNSLSKTYAMTGWRIGYAIGPIPLISAAAKIQSQNTSNPNSMAQMASVEALSGPQDDVDAMVREFQRRRDRMVQRMKPMEGLHFVHPEGAFFVFANVSRLLGKNISGKGMGSAAQVAELFLEEGGVVGVPGEDFGSPDHIRFSYATSLEEIEKGCDRLHAVMREVL